MSGVQTRRELPKAWQPRFLHNMIGNEFSHLDFDKQVLNLCRATHEWSVDDLCEQLDSPRGRVSASLSRLGRRHLLA